MSQVKPKKLPPGWTKQIITEGTGEPPKKGQTVICHYVGTLQANGKKVSCSKRSSSSLIPPEIEDNHSSSKLEKVKSSKDGMKELQQCSLVKNPF